MKCTEDLSEDATWEEIQERINFISGVRNVASV